MDWEQLFARADRETAVTVEQVRETLARRREQ